MTSNSAAFLPVSKATHLEVKSAPYPSAGESQIVIKNGAVAFNYLDYFKQDTGEMLYSWIKYPFVLGEDVAGEVVEVGPGVTRFKIGDRMIGHAVDMEKGFNASAQCAFQLYTVLQVHTTSPIPSGLSYENAYVLPLGLSTAACGLFQKDQLVLQYPSASPKPTGKTLLVWGGSTSVGSNAIQLAVAAGYEVFTTASPKNFDKCKGNEFVSVAGCPDPDPLPKRFILPTFIAHYISWSISTWIKSKTRSIGYKFILGGSLINNGVGKVIYEDFLPEALAQGAYIAAPDPLVVGKGLEHVQTAFELLRNGVSAKKVVVSL